ncbi:hypothetical protein E4U47_006497 [Claviceps purpurea]|nr:hypothetical protein E4U47_006497 [Claviceps purpurea]
MTVVLTLWHFGDVYKVKKWYDNDDVPSLCQPPATMSESVPHPPTPSPSLPLPPGPDPSEGAMALEPVRLLFLADAPSSRPPSPPLSPEPETSEMMEEPSPESSDSPPAAESAMGATEAWKMARGPLPPRTDQVREAMNGRDGDGVGGCGSDSDMVAGGCHSEG